AAFPAVAPLRQRHLRPRARTLDNGADRARADPGPRRADDARAWRAPGLSNGAAHPRRSRGVRPSFAVDRPSPGGRALRPIDRRITGLCEHERVAGRSPLARIDAMTDPGPPGSTNRDWSRLQ